MLFCVGIKTQQQPLADDSRAKNRCANEHNDQKGCRYLIILITRVSSLLQTREQRKTD